MGLGKSISKARTLGEIGSILYVISLVIPNAILLIGGVVLLLLSVLDIVRDTEYKGSGNSFIIAMILDIVWLYVAAFAVALTLGAYKAYVERPGADCMGPCATPVSQSLWTGRGRKNCCHGSIRGGHYCVRY